MARTPMLKALLTDGTVDKIVTAVRGGAFPYVAARAFGVPRVTHYRWMEAGERGAPLYREYWAKVSEAAAAARWQAEVEVRRENPLAWLRYGPGRERPDEPGWTERSEHAVNGTDGGPVRVVVEVVHDRND